ncbi:MAG: hypothetical protein ABIQ16_07250 [Polyangiaceae bacterium]
MSLLAKGGLEQRALAHDLGEEPMGDRFAWRIYIGVPADPPAAAADGWFAPP